MALADYQPMDSNEIPLSEGDIVELRKIGSDGWWFVRHVVTGEEGWAPASYLESVKRRSSHSTLSMSSLGKVLIACVFPHSLCAHLPLTHSTWLRIMVTHPLLLCRENSISWVRVCTEYSQHCRKDQQQFGHNASLFGKCFTSIDLHDWLNYDSLIGGSLILLSLCY